MMGKSLLKRTDLSTYIWRTPGKQLFKRSLRGESGQKETYILAGEKKKGPCGFKATYLGTEIQREGSQGYVVRH